MPLEETEQKQQAEEGVAEKGGEAKTSTLEDEGKKRIREEREAKEELDRETTTPSTKKEEKEEENGEQEVKYQKLSRDAGS